MKRLLVVLVAVAAVAGGLAAFIVNRNVESPLTGQSVSKDIAGWRPIAVMIDNISPGARPQAGLDKASLVFETLAEGGITRRCSWSRMPARSGRCAARASTTPRGPRGLV